MKERATALLDSGAGSATLVLHGLPPAWREESPVPLSRQAAAGLPVPE